MSNSVLNIIIRSISEGGGAQGTGDDLKKAKQRADDFKKALGFATAAVATLGLVAKKAFDFAKEGAGIELLETRFDRLATSIGTTGEALEDDLGDATEGMLSRTDMLRSSVDLMSLGLANSHDEAVRLAAVVSGLDMNLNQLTLTLTNKTTMRFDALGVRVDGFKEKLKALEKQGYSTDEAFKLAFLEQAEDQIERVGNVADTSMGEIKQFEAAWKDYSDTVKLTIASALLPEIKAMNDEHRMREELQEALDEGIITRKQLTKATGNYFWKMMNLNEAYALLIPQEKAVGMSAAETAEHIAGLQWALKGVEEVSPEVIEGFVGVIDEMDRLEDLMSGELGNAFDEFDEKQITLIGRTETLEGEIAELEGLAYLNTRQKQELNDLQTELGEVEAQVIKNKEEHAKATKSILFDMIQQRMAVDGLSAEEQKALSAIAADWGLIDETTKLAYDSFDELFEEIITDGAISATELMAINEWAGEIAGDYDINFNVSVNGSVPSLGGYVDETDPGGYSDEIYDTKYGAASGADFTVPDTPQFAGDGFGPVFFDAGERVIAVPKGQQGPAGGGGSTVVNVYLDGKLIERTVAKGLRKQGYNNRL